MRFVALAVVLAACGVEGSVEADLVDSQFKLDEGSPEAQGVLALLNGGVSFEALDVDADLDARAARSLVEHRDGGDGVFGTADDNLYDDLAEVDAQYYVGDSAMNKLAKYAAELGLVPQGAGSWEGVEFTAEEAELTLDLANTASLDLLDNAIGLDARAAQGIVDARPLADMDALAAAYFVGRSALEDLKAYALANQGAGPWESCNTTADCQDGLVCLGEINWGSGIFCVDDSMYDTFTYDEAVEIPDNGTVLTTSVNVQGLASVPVDVVLNLDIEHARKSDLVVSIDNFNGYGETVWLNEADPADEIIVRAFPSDDMVNGQYNLRVTDTVAGEAGELRGWSLYIVSNWD